jgi:hypothetical protein
MKRKAFAHKNIGPEMTGPMGAYKNQNLLLSFSWLKPPS